VYRIINPNLLNDVEMVDKEQMAVSTEIMKTIDHLYILSPKAFFPLIFLVYSEKMWRLCGIRVKDVVDPSSRVVSEKLVSVLDVKQPLIPSVVPLEPAALEPPLAVEPAALEPLALEPAALEPAAVEPAAVEPAAVEPPLAREGLLELPSPLQQFDEKPQAE